MTTYPDTTNPSTRKAHHVSEALAAVAACKTLLHDALEDIDALADRLQEAADALASARESS